MTALGVGWSSAPARAQPSALGRLVILGASADTGIELDGEPVGRGSLAIEGVPAGRHVLLASWPRGRTTVHRVDLGEGESIELRLDPPAAPFPRQSVDDDDHPPRPPRARRQLRPETRRALRGWGGTLLALGAVSAGSGLGCAVVGSLLALGDEVRGSSSTGTRGFLTAAAVLGGVGVGVLIPGIVMVAVTSGGDRTARWIPSVTVGAQQVALAWQVPF